jgi:hypothetical protein
MLAVGSVQSAKHDNAITNSISLFTVRMYCGSIGMAAPFLRLSLFCELSPVKPARKKSAVSDRKRSRNAESARPSKAKPRTFPGGPLGAEGAHWTFLTNHSHVLVLLSRNPFLVLREVALQVGITERAVQRIVADLESAGVIEREKIGRQNHYRIRTKQPLRHTLTSQCTIGELLTVINGAYE